MQPIDLDDLSSVRGGFGAILGSLLNAAGPIMNGVSSIIGAAKAGKGGGGGAPAGGEAGGPPPAPQMLPAMPASSGGDSVSVSVSINGRQVR